MFTLAIIQFPGSTGVIELQRCAKAAGFATKVISWNQPNQAVGFDAYVLPGGFSFGDYSRSGLVAAHSVVMRVIKLAAAAGKPVIGFGNGFQILIESGLLPGLPNVGLAGGVGENIRVTGGSVQGVGYYHADTYIQSVAEAGRCALNVAMPEGSVIHAPSSQRYGRLVLAHELLLELERHDQILYKYCTVQGVVQNQFPTTPNASVWGIVGICNPLGNVVGCMAHPERTESGEVLFESLRLYIEKSLPTTPTYQLEWKAPNINVETYQPSDNSLELFIHAISDKYGTTVLTQLLQQYGFIVELDYLQHWEIWYKDPQLDRVTLAQHIMNSGELIVSPDQRYSIEAPQTKPDSVRILVRSIDDYEGKLMTRLLRDHFGLTTIDVMHQGIFWTVRFPNQNRATALKNLSDILQTYILYNPYIHECLIIN